MRIRIAFFLGAATAVVFMALNGPAPAQNKSAGPSSSMAKAALPPSVVADVAERLLKEMSAYIGSAEQFTFHADITFDHVLPTGQKLRFAATEDVALQRPNGLYVEWSGDLGSRHFWYDGKAVTIYDPDAKFYATDKTTGGIDGMLDKTTAQLNFAPPLADFLNGDPYQSLRGSIQYGFAAGEAMINGHTCNAIAFVEQHIDWQIWIDSGPQRVPCKILITYKNNPSLPQFIAILSDWNFAPRIAPSVFTPNLPSGTEEIPFETATASAGSK